MTSYVLDTSVTIAWYLEETFSRSARLWQERMLSSRVTLYVPSLHYYEFANVLRTLVQRREITKELALETYELHIHAPLDVIEPERKLLLDIALEYGATAYDAAYISLALSQGIPLITAEKTTTPWVNRLRNSIELVR